LNNVQMADGIFAERIVQAPHCQKGHPRSDRNVDDILDSLNLPELGKQRCAVTPVSHRTDNARQYRKLR
jgi:hypothetical protein